MSDETNVLGNLPELTSLSPEETQAVAALGTRKDYGAGETVYEQGAPGGDLFAIEEGSVDLLVTLADGVEKHHVTLPSGTVFGSMAFFDGGAHPATARAAAPCRIVAIGRAEFDGFCEQHPATGIKLYRYLTETVALQSRLVVEKYMRTLQWSLEISAATQLNLQRLITDRVEVRIELASGKEVRGTLLQFDSSPAGYELLLRSPDRELIVVPYHAVTQFTLAAEQWRDVPESPETPIT